MPKKIYTIENLDCAHCAARVEEKIRQVPGVQEATVSFPMMQLHLTAEDPDALLEAVTAAARQIERDIRFLPRQEQHDHSCEHNHHECGCGHDHEHHHDHDHAHEHTPNGELTQLLIGGGLFLLSLLADRLLPGWPAAVLFAAAWLILGWQVLKTAGQNLLRGKVFDENFLMSLATLGAFCIGQYPEAAGVMLFYRVGEFFEHKALERSRSQIMAAVDLRPEEVELVTEGESRRISAGDAKPGDVIRIRPGDRIPLDGIALEGSSRIDTAPVTGEPVPVTVAPGDNVVSGCVNVGGLLTVKVEKPLSESMVTRILHSVENAAAGKPRMDRFITRFCRYYTPAVVGIAAAVAILPGLFDGNWSHWVYTALSFLVISCPCALVLSVPLTFFSGIGAGSRKGILMKDGNAIEALSAIKAVALDKTGTLTKGDFTVQQVEGDILRLCASCESASTHPIAQSIVAAAGQQGLQLTQPEQLEEIPGHGITARLEGKEVLCGNEKLMARFGIALPQLPPISGGTRVLAAVDGSFAGWLHISDTVKEDAPGGVEKLHQLGLSTAMLTGDADAAARSVANKVGIQTVFSRLLPEEKLEALRQLRKAHSSVMFVGDGINDAPVLAGADVGAAMGSGADAAIEAADVVFLNGRVEAIAEAVRIARATRAIAWQNVIFALAVKLGVMLLGILGHASMWAAVFADSGVALLCVCNAVRLLYRRQKSA